MITDFLLILSKKFRALIKNPKLQTLSEANIFFAQQVGDPSKKCDNLTKEYDKALEWEHESVSISSPGKVTDDEILARNIFSPIHFNEKTGELDPMAFDDIFNKGLSTVRLSQSNHETVINAGKLKLQQDHAKGHTNRQYIGYKTIQTKEFRTYIDTDLQKQVLAVYDTAEPTFIFHADACRIFALNKPQRTRLRVHLKTKFSEIIDNG